MALFDIKNLSFFYPAAVDKRTLQDVSLSVAKGEFVALVGKSGSGKTTLLRHLKTVLTPHGKLSGEICFDGRPLGGVSLCEQSARIGFVMQNPDDQIVTDKVWHELAFGLESLGCEQREMRLRVAEMASYFGIQGWFYKNVSELSGGQRQLLNLASIMAMQPDVLILDEPTSQLDPIAASDFLNTVCKINRELGTTVLITEHRLEDIFPVADRVIVMDGGRIIADDSPRLVGQALLAENNDMFSAMPASVRIFYGTGAHGECPLTVREGRSWLTSEMEGISAPAVPDAEPPVDEDAEAALSVKEVWFRYEKEAPDVLKGVSFEVPRGSLFALLGGNGTGKSTLLKSICGICPPYRGKIRINGKALKQYKGDLFMGNLAMLPQDPQSLFVKKTVHEELIEMLPAQGREEKIRGIAETCEITDLLDSHPYDLSVGEQQRAALAKVLLTEPKLLLLDEPTKGIDNFFKQKFARVLKRLTQSGVTVVMVSHDVEFCAAYADLVGMFFDGQIVTVNTPRRFFARNCFYTTAANRMSRHIFPDAVTAQDVISLTVESKESDKR